MLQGYATCGKSVQHVKKLRHVWQGYASVANLRNMLKSHATCGKATQLEVKQRHLLHRATIDRETPSICTHSTWNIRVYTHDTHFYDPLPRSLGVPLRYLLPFHVLQAALVEAYLDDTLRTKRRN